MVILVCRGFLSKKCYNDQRLLEGEEAEEGTGGAGSVVSFVLKMSHYQFVGFEVLTAVFMKSSIFWDVTLCSPLKVNRRFGGTCRLHHQGQRINRATSMKAGGKQSLPPAGYKHYLRVKFEVMSDSFQVKRICISRHYNACWPLSVNRSV
jgi:hypothetical protein